MKIKHLILPLLFSFLFSCNNGTEISSKEPTTSSEEIISEVIELPEISTLEKTYFNYNSYDNYKITLEEVNSIAILHLDGEIINKENYIFNDQSKELIVSNNYLVEKGYGSFILSINKSIHYCVVVYDEREPSLVGESTFKYLGQKHPTFEFNLYGCELKDLIHDDVSYVEYASVKNNTLTINGSLCEKFISQGKFKEQEFKVVFAQYLPTEEKSFSFDITIYIPTQGGTIIK